MLQPDDGSKSDPRSNIRRPRDGGHQSWSVMAGLSFHGVLPRAAPDDYHARDQEVHLEHGKISSSGSSKCKKELAGGAGGEKW